MSDETNRMTAPTHAILGAGGVDGTIGACLAHLGDSVTLVVRRDSLAPYPRALHFEGTIGSFDVNVSVAAHVPPVDVLSITVKATQLEAALTAVKNPGAVRAIVPLLNGVDHVALLRSKYGVERVIPATIAAEMERDASGHIVQRGPAPVLSVSSAGRSWLENTLAQLQKLGFGGRFIDDEPTMLWGKLVFLAPSALSTTAADKPMGGILSDPEWHRLMEACVREACAVGVAEGAKVDAEKVLDRIMKMPPNGRSSMQKDVDNHNPPELDAVAGPILRGGQKHGIDVPATEKLVAFVSARVLQKKPRLAGPNRISIFLDGLASKSEMLRYEKEYVLARGGTQKAPMFRWNLWRPPIPFSNLAILLHESGNSDSILKARSRDA